MWSRSELKTNAKAALKKYFWKALVAIIIVAAVSSCVSWVINTIVGLVTGVSTSSMETLQNLNDGATSADIAEALPEGYTAATSLMGLLNLAAQIFLIFPISVGLYRFFEKSRGVVTGFGEIFVPLKKCVHVGLVMLWMGIKVFLWSLLFVIPGIIKAYEYSMVPYLLAENPELSSKRAFQISKAMTKGYKGKLFVLDLSFILWYLLGICTCGLAFIWVVPYVEATSVEAYYKLKANAVANGGLTLQEVPDICLPEVQQPVVPFGQAATTTDGTVAASNNTSSVVTTAAAAAVATAATAAANAVSNTAADTTAAASVTEAVTEAAAAPTIAEKVAEAAPVEAVEAPVEAVKEAVEAPVEAVKEAVEEAAEKATEAAPVEAVKEAAEEVAEKVSEIADKVAETAPVEAVKEAAEKVSETVEAPAEAAKEAIDNAVDQAAEKVSEVTGASEETVKEVVEKVAEKVSEKAETPSAE